MLPLLTLADDGEVRSLAESREAMSAHFNLTPEELKELLPSGTQPVLNNRVAWSSIYLMKAGLLCRPKRGHYQITDRGRELLSSKPDRIDIKILAQFPEFVEFREKKKRKSDDSSGTSGSETPEEALEDAYQQIRSDLAEELLTQVKDRSAQFFERLVVELLVAMGYGGSRKDAAMAVGQSGDEGIDGIIKEDRLGLDAIYIQAKRWQGTVGRPEIQKFVGALHGKHARKGVFITTGTFSSEARTYTLTIDSKVVLIDGTELAELMIDHGVGVSPHVVYEVKRIDSDYFLEE
jgi:restriction system protein